MKMVVFTKPVTDYVGEKVFSVNPKIIDRLKLEGKLVKNENI